MFVAVVDEFSKRHAPWVKLHFGRVLLLTSSSGMEKGCACDACMHCSILLVVGSGTFEGASKKGGNISGQKRPVASPAGRSVKPKTPEKGKITSFFEKQNAA